ncbi:hypothetical protein HORIV_05610 [Vreelandella olivaria]|uniref:Uncharacterized protein n=1 Tax=Vreelandella olivaria TaxID=390919 RepID=A0ABN5WST6_9GAMM|nr:hypothetical protein HORIV_05610 [Halomonas olivaria]
MLIYVAFVLLLGIPVMMAEILIGRAGRRGPMQALGALAAEAGRHLTGAGWAFWCVHCVLYFVVLLGGVGLVD